MASRFTQGTSEHTTRTITKKAVDPKPGMQGMPGPVKTGQSASRGGLIQATGAGPHREGPIGHKGSSSSSIGANRGRGTMEKSYRAASLHPSGKPTGGAPMYGGTAKAPGGHKGRMEAMKGRAKSSWEK